MNPYDKLGAKIREEAKKLVLDYMDHQPDTKPNGQGLRQAQIFKACGSILNFHTIFFSYNMGLNTFPFR